LSQLSVRLEELRQRIEVAAVAAGRNPGEVELLPVSKGQPAEAVREAIGLGLSRFGESYVSEAIPKIAKIVEPVDWVYLGPIQSNKTRPIAENFAAVLGLSALKAGYRLSSQRPAGLPPLSVCIQVNVDADPAKSGIGPDELAAFVEEISALPNLVLRGLMTVPRMDSGGDTPGFATMAALFERHRDLGAQWDTLSMGMSADFEQAIAHGATQVRLGTALFGPRAAKRSLADHSQTSGRG